MSGWPRRRRRRRRSCGKSTRPRARAGTLGKEAKTLRTRVREAEEQLRARELVFDGEASEVTREVLLEHGFSEAEIVALAEGGAVALG